MCMIDDSTKVVILHEGSGVLTSVHFRCMYEMERFICPYGRGYYRQKKIQSIHAICKYQGFFVASQTDDEIDSRSGATERPPKGTFYEYYYTRRTR